MTVDPHPVRTRVGNNGKPQPVLLPKSFPVLVPGQRWVITWDTIFDRNNSELPERHEVTIAYKGIKDQAQLATKFVLDWDTPYSRSHIDVKTVHHVASELHQINSTLDKMLSDSLVHRVELVEIDWGARRSVPMSEVLGIARTRMGYCAEARSFV